MLNPLINLGERMNDQAELLAGTLVNRGQMSHIRSQRRRLGQISRQALLIELATASPSADGQGALYLAWRRLIIDD